MRDDHLASYILLFMFFIMFGWFLTNESNVSLDSAHIKACQKACINNEGLSTCSINNAECNNGATFKLNKNKNEKEQCHTSPKKKDLH